MRIIILYSCLDVALCPHVSLADIQSFYFNISVQFFELVTGNINTLAPPLINPDAWEQMYPE